MITLDAQEAAALLRLTPQTLARMARRGEIQAYKVRRRWLFERAHIERVIQRGSNQQAIRVGQLLRVIGGRSA